MIDFVLRTVKKITAHLRSAVPGVVALSVLITLYAFAGSPANTIADASMILAPGDTDSTVVLPYPMYDESQGMPQLNDYNGGLYLNPPSNIKTDVKYNTETNQFDIYQKMGDINYRPPIYMSQEEYIDYEFDRSVKEYWKQRSAAESMAQEGKSKNLIAPIKINSEVFDRIFGSNVVDIRPQGSAELIFGVNSSFSDNPAIPVRNRRITTFDFDEKIQLSLIGKIGDRLKITTNYNTQATFDFENRMKLEFTGGEDDIIKKIEAGNVSLPLNSTLISGSQSLFGLKTQLQFGKALVTTVVSQEKGQKKEITVEGGAQTTDFEINGDNYESNKHFFLSQHFKDRYDSALKTLPVINSLVNVNKVEIWITNTSSNINDTRNIVALTDMGENAANYISNPVAVQPNANNGIPDNTANTLNPVTFVPANPGIRNKDSVAAILQAKGFEAVRDFEKILSARKLSASEFSYNPQLGFVSLNTTVNPDQVVGVAFQYTQGGVTYQVGELSTDGIADPNCLFVKMLKSTNVSTRRDTLLWDLMMKNVYAMGAYQVSAEDFKLEILYNNPSTGTDIPVLPEKSLAISSIPLLQVMHLDRINVSGDAFSDGVFDFIDGVTINASNGRLYLPVRKPFGEHLRQKINPGHADVTLTGIEDKYAYDVLYDSTKFAAQQFPDKNRFKMRGRYKSASGAEISLSAPNIPDGSVVVTAGGAPLTENVDYTVDYALGKVKIINEGILQSGTPIKISFESNVLFGFQQKTLIGSTMEYTVNRDFSFGATAIRLSERPIIQKVNIGDEPIKNTVLGLDGKYRTEFASLTRLVDKLPMYSTKEMSTVSAKGEVAALIPGHSRAIGKEGNAYIDDFEGSQSPIEFKAFQAWSLASTPQSNPLWPEGSRLDTVYGFNRAKLAWYVIDPMFMRETNNLTPSYYTKSLMSDNFQREIFETEIFPKKESQTGQPVPMQTLDLAYYPTERGQYNYDATGFPGVSAGTGPNGELLAPQTRWGGIQRKVETNDFEAANVEFIQLWMMDPFNSDVTSPANPNNGLDPNASGELIIHLGNISEDVLRDGKQAFEHGLPISSSDQTHPTENTPWGKVPKVQALVNAFDNDPNSRAAQDVGLDGLPDAEEQAYFKNFLDDIQTVGSGAYNSVANDPSSDFYHYYRGDDYDAAQLNTLNRYKSFNGLEANSPVSAGAYPTSATSLPSSEDINRDNNLSENEGYYQYRIKINANDLTPANIGNNYINDVVSGGGSTIDNNPVDVKWYQLKIPVREFEARYGNIEDFRSIRFIRMVMRGFSKPVVLRFARMDFIRGEWRKYTYDLASDGEYLGADNPGTSFDVSAVNYQENGTKSPVNYVLPPGIEQQLSYGPSNPIHQNEQALALKVCNLEDGDARATYKNVDLDVRSYKKMRLYIHAEAAAGAAPVYDNQLTAFVRLGTDYTQNYYEYEIPLYITPAGSYNNNLDSERELVWRTENEMELDFAALQDGKQSRNAAIFAGSAALNQRYQITVTDGEGRTRYVYIKGNPNLSGVKTIMVGIRNPKKLGPDDDGLAKCAEVWVNELRLADFDEKGGWASTAHVTTKLADLGTVTLAGSYSTPGWGSIEKKVSERQRERRYQYDMSTQIALHKFTPEKWGLNLPMYIGYSQATIRPQYNPLDPDILLNPVLKDENLPLDYRDSLREVTIDRTNRKSVNFTNVKKNRPQGSKRNNIWDVENLSVSYSYAEFFNRSAMIDHHSMRDHKAAVLWGWSKTPKAIEPFKKSKLLSKKAFALIRDFNFTPYPGTYAVQVGLDRHYSEKLDRNTTGLDIPMIPFFDKRYTMIRMYTLKWDLTRSLKLDLQATNNSRILEPQGAIDTKEEKTEIQKSLLSGGNNTLYSQQAKANYNIPINKFPLLDWINANAGYSTDYKWTRAPYSADSLGNKIQNGNQKTLNLQGNMVNLYNKIPYLKKINQGIKKDKSQGKGKGKNLPAPTVPAPKNPQDSTKKEKEKKPFIAHKYVIRSLMMVKNVSVNFTGSEGQSLAGFNDSTNLLGMSRRYAPGPGFVFGQQKNFGPDGNLMFTDYAAEQGWLVSAMTLNTPYMRNKTENITARASVEPFPDVKIDINANRNLSRNYSEFFRWAYDSVSGTYDFEHQSPTESGNFSMSFISWKTAFDKIKDNYESDAFNTFLKNREIISAELAELHGNAYGQTGNYFDGYGPTAQQTMMFAFLSAYSGRDAATYPLSVFPNTPAPNWRVTYNGLSRIERLKKLFKVVNISHAYKSSYSFSYTNNPRASMDEHTPTTIDANGDFIFNEQISTVTIAEQLSPLIKIDVTMQNSVQLNIAYKKERNLALSFANNQLTEVNSKEIVLGTGYRWKDLVIRNPFKPKKGQKGIKSDLNLKADFSIRNNLTMIRKVVEEVTQPTAGQTIYSLKLSGDYLITQRITARLFYDWLFTNPKISTSFRSSNTNAGVSLRFSLN